MLLVIAALLLITLKLLECLHEHRIVLAMRLIAAIRMLDRMRRTEIFGPVCPTGGLGHARLSVVDAQDVARALSHRQASHQVYFLFAACDKELF